MLKKLIVCVSLIVLSQILHAESRAYYLGTLNLAGLVPTDLPEPGTQLGYQTTSQALTTVDQPIGYIPRKFRPAIDQMLEQGLELRIEVSHLFANPLPGKFVSVEIWVTTQNEEKIRPLIYSIPVLEPPPLTAMNDE
jgi:hypothetical protein